MKRFDLKFCTMLFFLLLLFFSGKAQQTLVDAKRISARDSIKLGGVWRSTWPAGSLGTAWQLTGDAGTNATTNFIGTTNAVDFVTRTNNIERLRVSSGTASSQLLKVSAGTITTGIGAYINSGATTGIGLYVDANGITSGKVAEFATTSAGNLSNGAVKIGATSNHTGYLLNLLDASTATTVQLVQAPNLTTGTGLEINSSSNGLNSTNGLLYVNNSGVSVNGILARFRANSGAGSGMTIKANGFVGFGTANPVYQVDIVGNLKLTNGSQALGRVLKCADASGVGEWVDPLTFPSYLQDGKIAFGSAANTMTSSNNLLFNGSMFILRTSLDGIYLAEDIQGGESGLYSWNADQMIATFQPGANRYYYANSSLSYDASAEKLTLSGDAEISNSLQVGNKLNVVNVTNYADNAAAILGGLVIGDVYRTGDILKIVH